MFVGDTLFMPDYGTARADFPGGDAHKLYRSMKRLPALLPETRLFMCHDYKAPGRDTYAWETTVREEREEGVTEDEFVACARRLTSSSRHRGGCCPPSRSTSAPANSRRPKLTGCTISLFP
jgi:glyoxylase-like metal-dependent hydrolase (beta-lactamase superfamily II)